MKTVTIGVLAGSPAALLVAKLLREETLVVRKEWYVLKLRWRSGSQQHSLKVLFAATGARENHDGYMYGFHKMTDPRRQLRIPCFSAVTTSALQFLPEYFLFPEERAAVALHNEIYGAEKLCELLKRLH
jgi:hypothetical protein